MGDGGDGDAGDGVAGDGEVGDVGDRVGLDTGVNAPAWDGLGTPAGDAGHCRDGWLPAQDWAHCPLLTASTTFASRIEDPQTKRSRPVTASQLLFSTVW